MRIVKRLTLWLFATLLASTATLSGQAVEPLQIECIEPLTTGCTASIAPGDSIQRMHLVFRVTRSEQAVPGAVVGLSATSGSVHPKSVVADSDGNARAIWLREKGASEVAIAVEARDSVGRAAVTSVLLQPSGGPQLELVGRVGFDHRLSGFESTPLHPRLIVEIRRQVTADSSIPFSDSAACNKQRVVFRTLGKSGSILPDTAVPLVYETAHRLHPLESYGEPAKGCFARAYWTLGEKPGVRFGQAELITRGADRVAQPPLRAEALARALPSFLLGAVLSRETHEYFRLREGTEETIQVQRTSPEGSILKYDSIVPGTASLDSLEKRWSPMAMVGISSPIITSQTWLRLTAGVSVASPTDDWFLGSSFFHLLALPHAVTGWLPWLGRGLWPESERWAIAREALPIDIHLLSHWGRTMEVVNADACKARDADPERVAAPCSTEPRHGLKGWAVMLSIDAGTVLSEVIKKLGS